jgi:hypothetical protein
MTGVLIRETCRRKATGDSARRLSAGQGRRSLEMPWKHLELGLPVSRTVRKLMSVI